LIDVFKLGVIGDPVEHSLSPAIHHQFGQQTNIELAYKAYHVKKQELENFIQAFFKNGGHGLNVTLPHKLDCLDLADIVSDEVRILGAANTLMLNDEKQIVAESTDGKGFIDDCTEKKIQIENKNILIIGAGGASQSIIPSIAYKKPNRLMIDNRSKEKITPLVQKFAEFGVEQFNDLDLEIDLVINATSAGFSGPFQWDINRGLSQKTIFYDLSYGDASIEFLNWSNKFSDKTFDGAGMLVAQAAHSFNLWFNKLPSTKNINF
jgi:shikimate dehydrogenase|tara:strand:- start:1420 stop:2211 length:792 start_codon:yes stop_codon:yes gene_type:complete